MNTCIACTSTNGDNPDCEENPDKFPGTACDEQYGNDYCFTLVTHNKKPTESWVWNSTKTFFYKLYNLICLNLQEAAADLLRAFPLVQSINQTMRIMSILSFGEWNVNQIIVTLKIQGIQDFVNSNVILMMKGKHWRRRKQWWRCGGSWKIWSNWSL